MSFSGSYITNFLFVVVAIYVLKFVVCYKRRSLALTWNMWLAKSANVNCGERAKVQDMYCTAATKNEICWDFMFSHHKALLSTFVAQWISRKVLLRTRHTLDTSEIWDCLHFTNPSMFLADSICMTHWMQAEDIVMVWSTFTTRPGSGNGFFENDLCIYFACHNIGLLVSTVTCLFVFPLPPSYQLKWYIWSS